MADQGLREGERLYREEPAAAEVLNRLEQSSPNDLKDVCGEGSGKQKAHSIFRSAFEQVIDAFIDGMIRQIRMEWAVQQSKRNNSGNRCFEIKFVVDASEEWTGVNTQHPRWMIHIRSKTHS